MGIISDILPEIAAAGITAFTRGGPRRQYKWNKKAAEDANRMNRENQERTLQQNLRIQAEQRVYDSAESQMARYKAAGLNPHLLYGSGGGAGGAFPVDAGNVPGVNVQPPSASYPDVGASFISAGQSLAQTALTKARTDESGMSAAYKSVLIDIAKTNPMLSPGVAERVALSMYKAAELKSSTDTHLLEGWTKMDGKEMRLSHAKIEADVRSMIQDLGLKTLDLKIKNEIFSSKEFENALKEIQVKWMRDNEITPQLMLQGGMQILKQLLGAGLQK